MPFVGNIGPLELIVILAIILLIFGPKRLPGIGRSLGTGMREFKDSVTGKSKEEERAELPSSPEPAAPEPAPEPQPAGAKPKADPFGRD